MISLDWSIVPAILIFILTIVALNYLLILPICRIQEEREKRTTGLVTRSRQDLDHQMQLFDQYQATIKNARMEGYRLVERARSEALSTRGAALGGARTSAEQLIRDGRESLQHQVATAKVSLDREARETAGRIAAAILH
jgi:F-type H+-transporting ATPase subunit b